MLVMLQELVDKVWDQLVELILLFLLCLEINNRVAEKKEVLLAAKICIKTEFEGLPSKMIFLVSC